MAEGVRFELTDGEPPPVFETGALIHSANLPVNQCTASLLVATESLELSRYRAADFKSAVSTVFHHVAERTSSLSMACPARVERATCGFGDRCSVPLSYGHNWRTVLDSNQGDPRRGSLA